MKNLSFFILFAGILGFVACKKDESGKVSKNGYSYDLYKTGKGELIQVNDLVFFDLQIKHKDSLLQDSKANPTQPEFLMPADSMVTTPNPVVDAMKLMREGDSIVIRERIDTIKNLPPNMKDWKEITYVIKIKKVVTEKLKEEVRQLEPDVEKTTFAKIAEYKSGGIKDLKTTPTGLKYTILSEGGGPLPVKGEAVNVYYYGATVSDSKKFDSSYSRGTHFGVPLGAGKVIPGWEEALLLLKKGTKAVVFIPGKLAYGEQGIPDMIAPNAELAFYIEVLK